MKMLVAVLALFATSAFAGEPISAAGTPPPNAVTFGDLDVNRDGVISFSEAAANARIANSFNALDSNADGVLSVEEFRNALR